MRSTITRLLAAAALGGGMVLFAAGPAAAHGDTIDFALSTDTAGRILATATWADDQDPVTDPIGATLTATTASGKQVGPLPLGRLPGKPNVLVLEQRLEAGSYTVLVESAEPAIGRGEATLTIAAPVATVVGAESAPQPTRALGVQPASPVAEVTGLSLLALAVGLGGLLIWRRRTA